MPPPIFTQCAILLSSAWLVINTFTSSEKCRLHNKTPSPTKRPAWANLGSERLCLHFELHFIFVGTVSVPFLSKELLLSVLRYEKKFLFAFGKAIHFGENRYCLVLLLDANELNSGPDGSGNLLICHTQRSQQPSSSSLSCAINTKIKPSRGDN